MNCKRLVAITLTYSIVTPLSSVLGQEYHRESLRRLEGVGVIVGGLHAASKSEGLTEEQAGSEAPPLNSFPFAWSEDKVRTWAMTVEKWLDQTEVMLSLIEPENWRFKDGRPLSSQPMSRFVQHTQSQLEEAKKWVVDLQRSPYDLLKNFLITEHLEKVADGLETSMNIHDSIDRSTGPSRELALKLFNHGLRGRDLLSEKYWHYRTLVEWFSLVVPQPVYSHDNHPGL